MSNVLIAFTGGVESTYLVQKMLEEGCNVWTCYLNVSGNETTMAGEIMQRKRILNWFKEEEKRFEGTLKDDFCLFTRFTQPVNIGRTADYSRPNYQPGHYPVNQQLNTIMGLTNLRLELMEQNVIPLVGWVKDDTLEETYYGYDITKKDYRELLELGPQLLKLGNGDRSGRPFLAPLLERSKKDCYNSIIDEIKPFIIANGLFIHENDDGDLVIYHSSDKVKEYAKAGIPINSHSVIKPITLTLRECFTLRNLSWHSFITDSLKKIPSLENVDNEILTFTLRNLYVGDLEYVLDNHGSLLDRVVNFIEELRRLPITPNPRKFDSAELLVESAEKSK